MTYFLIFAACFQFVCIVAGVQQTPIYLVLNPYVTLLPCIAIWLAGLGYHRHPSDKNILIIWLALLFVQVAVFASYARSDGFPLNLVRSLQFFWGPALMTPTLIGLFRITSEPGDPEATAQSFIRGLCMIASTITILEVLLVSVLHVAPARIPWVTNLYGGPYRPFGLAAYPQPNAVILALLFWLSFLYRVPGNAHRMLTLLALGLTLGATGQLTFLTLVPLWTRRPFIFSGIALGLGATLVAYATLTHSGATDNFIWKFDLSYISSLTDIFWRVLRLALMQFSSDDIIWGSAYISPAATTGLTHDWAYFDVFYVSGLVGLANYVLLYAAIVWLALPRTATVNMRLYFVIIALIANFHYGTLNYFIGQMLISVLAALNLHRRYTASQSEAEATMGNRGLDGPVLGSPAGRTA